MMLGRVDIYSSALKEYLTALTIDNETYNYTFATSTTTFAAATTTTAAAATST